MVVSHGINGNFPIFGLNRTSEIGKLQYPAGRLLLLCVPTIEYVLDFNQILTHQGREIFGVKTNTKISSMKMCE